MKLEIRPARPEDHDEWIRMRSEMWPECPVDRHRLEISQILASPGVVALAVAEGKVAGFAELSIRSDHVEGTETAPVPYLEAWYVASAQRGRGIGRALLSFLEQWAVSEGFSEIASDAELGNLPGIRLHKSLGFREVGRSVHFVKALERGARPRVGKDAGGRFRPGELP